MNNPEEKSPKDMGLMDHLSDLRSCFIHIFASITLCAFVMFYYSTIFFDILNKPFKDVFGEGVLIGTGPAEALTLKILVAIFSGMVVALPYIFYQIWRFISPALYENERKWALPFIIVTSLFFIAGICFCYYLVLPITFDFFFKEYTSISLMPQIRLSEQISFTVKALVAFGVIFELPVLSFILARLGILNSKMMTSSFRYVIVGIFIIAAVLTPPDVVSQFLMAAPMLVLYGLSIIIVRISQR